MVRTMDRNESLGERFCRTLDANPNADLSHEFVKENVRAIELASRADECLEIIGALTQAGHLDAARSLRSRLLDWQAKTDELLEPPQKKSPPTR